jgi:major vault protein
MYLADPRKEVIVRRVLEPKQVALWFPGNQEALEYNAKLLALTRAPREDFDEEEHDYLKIPAPLMSRMEAVGEGFAGDEFQRGKKFTPPRTITLDTKYEGAVAINVWTGYAVLVVGKTGERKVFTGPGTYLLEYEEILEAIEFSTGTPKNDKRLEKSVYLRVLHNKVSDIVEAETKDLCQVHIQLSYRVNFEGEAERWFGVENYVKFLCDHMRSLLRHAIKNYGIETFYADAISIVRDTVLGQVDDNHKRNGRIFSENGMRIYDVEVLNVTIGDHSIAELLVDAQHKAVQQALELNAARQNLEATQEKEELKRQLAQAQNTTQSLLLNLEMKEVQGRLKLNLSELEAKAAAQTQELEAHLAEQVALGQINDAELARRKAQHELELDVARQQLDIHLQHLRAEVQAVVDKAGAVSPHLVATLQSFSERALAERIAQNMAPLAILGGTSVADVFAQLLKGTVLEKVLTPQEIKAE